MQLVLGNIITLRASSKFKSAVMAATKNKPHRKGIKLSNTNNTKCTATNEDQYTTTYICT